MGTDAAAASCAPGHRQSPCDTPLPTASNINFASGQTIANAVITKLSRPGRVCIYTSAPSHLIVDLEGTDPPTPG
jgi:hypothetical protein